MVILKADISSVIQRDSNGVLPLHYAIAAGHANLIIMFFEHYENYLEMISNQSGHSVSTDEKPPDLLLDFKGLSLLHFACYFGHSTCTETICDLSDSYPFLVDMLLNTNDEICSNFNKFSPMHCACATSHEECMNNLLEKFAEKQSVLVELEDDNGNRPLHICAMNNEYTCTAILLEANCKLNPRNKLGQTPFMLIRLMLWSCYSLMNGLWVMIGV